MLFKDRKITSVSALLRAVESHAARARKTPIWFRGCPNKKYGLIPSLGRKPFKLEYERGLINSFKQNAVQFVDQRPQSEWEWLFVCRHHALPTRLLDWTESPLIALYFAVHSDPKSSDARADGALWLLLPAELNRMGNIKMADDRALPIFEDNDEHLRNYLPSTLASEIHSRLTPAAGIAIRHSKRMQAQHSVFTVTHRDQTAIEDVGSGKGRHIGKYIIPRASKFAIRKQLAALRMDRLGVFPELDNVALLARDFYNG